MAKRLKNLLIYWAVRLLFGLLRLGSFAAALGRGRRLGRMTFRLAGSERRRTLAHLEIAFPEQSPDERRALARSVFEHLGQGVAEVVRADELGDVLSYVRFEESERRPVAEGLARGRGLLWVTAHCGNWELMARAIAAAGFPVSTIGQKSYDPRLTRLLSRFRDDGRVHTLWRGEPDLMARMVEVLRRGEVMGLLIDQDTRVPGAFVPFFGRPAWTPTAPAVLARKTGAAVVCGFNHRLPEGGLRMVVEPFEPCALADPAAAIAADTAALTAAIERHVRAHPAEWVWMHRRWKTRPE